MRIKAGFIATALVGVALSAHAFTSPYASMGVAGTHNSWDKTPSMTLVADNTWVCTQTLTSANGEFKFVSNNDWNADDWGGAASIARVPAAAAAVLKGTDLAFAGLTPGPYRFTFNDSTLTFQMEWAGGTPLPLPAITNLNLIGTFNNWAPTATSQMTNHVDNTNVWSLSIELFENTDFQFYVNDSWDNQFGAPQPTTITLPGLHIPVTNSACGKSDFSLEDILPGTFQFALNVSNATFTITQTATNSAGALASVTAVGNFVAGTPPDINLEKIGSSTWRSDFNVTNTGSFQLSFIGRDANGVAMRYWGVTHSPALSLPATGSMLPAASNVYTHVTITAPPGNYRITFDSASGAFSVQQRYTAASGVNYLQNPSFESLDGGQPAHWGTFHAQSGEQANFGAHSGARCGVLFRKTIEADGDLGNFDQTTSVLSGLSGQTFRVSAAFRTLGNWQAETVRIIIEWKSGETTIKQDSLEVIDLSDEWRIHALEAPIPGNNLSAKILFKYDGDPGTGYLLVDDAEARIAASRFQDFNTWGGLNSFQPYSPDWAVTSGKTIYNLPASSPTGGVLISKYIEGTGNNKAIEIFNGTDAPIDLGANNYVLQQYNNGALAASVNISLSGTIPAAGTLVVARPNTPTNYAPNGAVYDVPLVLTNKALTFNGDDVITLRAGGAWGTILDRIGIPGTNAAGSVWSRFMTDHTLSRNHNVLWGTSSFDLSDWTLSTKDTFTELGIHFFSIDDPDAPYLPSGHSLLLNTNAAVMTPELDGGIGDLSFYARAQGALTGNNLQLAIETAPSQTSTNWTLAEILTVPIGTTNFTLFSSFANQAAHSVLRIRHIGDGSTNRIRIDDITVGPAYLIRRTENFAQWSDLVGSPIGTYSRAEWTIRNATINTHGTYDSVSADLHPTTGSVTSPTYEGGVGTVKFRLLNHPDDIGEVRAAVLTSTDKGVTWTTNGTATIPPTSTIKTIDAVIAIFLPTSACVRISAQDSPSPFVVDNIEIGIPSISRILDFDDMKTSTRYSSYDKEGWAITETAITSYEVFGGLSGLLRNGSITSPYIDDIGTISFYYKMGPYSGDNTARLTVEISANGSSWTPLKSGIIPSSETALYSYYNTNTLYHYVRITQTKNDKRMLIDQIEIGEPSPLPTCTISATLDPGAPGTNEAFYLMANVSPRNGAEILSVTAVLKVGPYQTITTTLTAVAYGTYQSSLIGPISTPGRELSYSASVRYGGIGAAPGSTSYTTNTAYSTTNTTRILAVKRGTVWINEIFYAPYLDEDGGGGIWGDTPYNHEFIELCGVAGTSITNWQVQLLLASAGDRLKNGGEPVYATYTIPSGTILSNTASGYGFYVIGDQQLLDNGKKVNQVLTTLVPASVNPYAADDLDHIRDPSGIIRLLDNYSNVIYSLSYGAYDTGSDILPVAQDPTAYNTNSLSLSGTGSGYDDFSWNKTNDLTIGDINTGQEFVEDSDIPMPAWHIPDALAQTSLQGTFHQFYPIDAAQSSVLYFHYAYTNANFFYANIGGQVHHHRQGTGGAWSIVGKQADFGGNFDTNGTGYAYLRMGPVIPYTYDRLDTIEYVIEAIPNNPAFTTAWLGSDGAGGGTAFASLVEAQQQPFQYTFPIADLIEITKITRTNTLLRLETDGNDTLDPIVNFNIRSTTNVLVPTHLWDAIAPQFIARTNEQNYITLTNPPGPNRFFSVQPLWP
ncbi:MAG: lamin tail domain-containing protein [Kiritimatiellae bacterium]|nr:lamin tail domain-containing protein [Kiritimatiellia bacterium]